MVIKLYDQWTSKNFAKVLFCIFSLLILYCFTFVCTASAQDYWTALPPYNTLWPLWSPALSPVNVVTGLPVPVVTNLASSTVLPVQPGLTWDPGMNYPWLLYNTPVGMAYFDPLYGINMWPPSNLIDPAGAPLPLTLPTGYNTLAPTSSLWLQQNVLFANTYFLGAYPSLLQSANPSLLLAAASIPLPPAVVAALTLGIQLPSATLTAIFPPPGITSFLTPAVLLGL